MNGEFFSEISVPVVVQYHRDADGRVEVLHVSLADGGSLIAGKLRWERLPIREAKALEVEARQHVDETVSEQEENRALARALFLSAYE